MLSAPLVSLDSGFIFRLRAQFFMGLKTSMAHFYSTPLNSLITFAAYFLCSEKEPTLLEQMVEELCQHVSDDSPSVRSLCLRGLVQVIILITAWIPILFIRYSSV